MHLPSRFPKHVHFLSGPITRLCKMGKMLIIF